MSTNEPPLINQPALTWWFTGLPGAGKTTLSQAWAAHWRARQHPFVLLDGDELRKGLTRDLGFSPADRLENMRRVAEVARLFNDAGVHALVALVSPSLQGRAAARAIVRSERFIEVYVSTPLAVCQARDPKGLYQRAANQEQIGLTGVQSTYEVPTTAELVIDTSQAGVADAVECLLQEWLLRADASPTKSAHF